MVRIKAAEPFKGMTVEIRQGERDSAAKLQFSTTPANQSESVIQMLDWAHKQHEKEQARKWNHTQVEICLIPSSDGR